MPKYIVRKSWNTYWMGWSGSEQKVGEDGVDTALIVLTSRAPAVLKSGAQLVPPDSGFFP